MTPATGGYLPLLQMANFETGEAGHSFLICGLRLTPSKAPWPSGNLDNPAMEITWEQTVPTFIEDLPVNMGIDYKLYKIVGTGTLLKLVLPVKGVWKCIFGDSFEVQGLQIFKKASGSKISCVFGRSHRAEAGT